MSRIDLKDCDGVWVDPDRRGGIPCIKGTRFPLSTILAELATGMCTLRQVCTNYDLTYEVVEKALNSLSWLVDHPNQD